MVNDNTNKHRGDTNMGNKEDKSRAEKRASRVEQAKQTLREDARADVTERAKQIIIEEELAERVDQSQQVLNEIRQELRDVKAKHPSAVL